jgi:protein SCO1/2
MTQKKSNNKFLIGIAVAFLLPLSLYLIVNKLSKGKVKLPQHYIIERIDSSGNPPKYDTTYHQVGDLVLTNQVGEKVSLNTDLKDKMVVIDFFFTECSSTCPKLSKSMHTLQSGFRKDPKKEANLNNDVHFISITVMPEHDSFQVLRTYADHYDANPDHWWFLTGDKKTIYEFARKQLGLVTGPGDGGADDFIHSEKLVLLDKNRFIRGYYNGLNDTDVRKCADDIVLLTLEKDRKKKK